MVGQRKDISIIAQTHRKRITGRRPNSRTLELTRNSHIAIRSIRSRWKVCAYLLSSTPARERDGHTEGADDDASV